ncbi:MAG: hypothetical protein HKN23_11020, partial [Verrucomicrobiales bacterium]|nr:hypothetical protein [Verrucomicrobiales bacterium]
MSINRNIGEPDDSAAFDNLPSQPIHLPVFSPHSMSLHKELQSAEGYLELGMFDEAWEALDELSADWQAEPAVMEMRVMLQMNRENWEDAIEWCDRLCEAAPQSHAGFIHGAYCLHELGRTAEARDKLHNGPSSLQKDPLFFYNLACYEAQLGETETARTWLDRACNLDRTLKKQAETDP